MSRIIKSIHSQLKPSKTLKNSLISQIRDGRAPELKKSPGMAIAAAAAVAVLAGGIFAFSYAGKGLDTAPADSVTVTSQEASSVETLSSLPDSGAADDLVISFDNSAETTYNWRSKYLSQETLSEDLKAKILSANRTITWNGVTYTASELFFTEHNTSINTGREFSWGKVMVNGTEHIVMIAEAIGYSVNHKIMLGLGDNVYYTYENKEYNYSDTEYFDFLKSSNPYTYTTTIPQEYCGKLLREVSEQISPLEDLVKNGTDDIMLDHMMWDDFSEDYYVVLTTDSSSIEGCSPNGKSVLMFGMGCATKYIVGDMYRNPDNTISVGVFETDDGTFYFSFQDFDDLVYTVEDHSQVLENDYFGITYMNITKEDQKKQIEEALEETKSLLEGCEIAEPDAGTADTGLFTYYIKGKGSEYYFYWYGSDGKAPDMPKGKNVPNLLIGDKAYRIPAEAAQKLSQLTESIVHRSRCYEIIDRSGGGAVKVLKVDEKPEYDEIAQWINNVLDKADAGAKGWIRHNFDPDVSSYSGSQCIIKLGSIAGGVPEDLYSDIMSVTYVYSGSLPSYTNEDGSTTKYNVVIMGTAYTVPEEAVSELLSLISGLNAD